MSGSHREPSQETADLRSHRVDGMRRNHWTACRTRRSASSEYAAALALAILAASCGAEPGGQGDRDYAVERSHDSIRAAIGARYVDALILRDSARALRPAFSDSALQLLFILDYLRVNEEACQ